MAKKKIKKREYVPPTHEVVNRKERVRRSPAERKASAAASRSTGGQRSGRGRDWQPPVPSWRRTFRRLPLYFLLLFGLEWFLPTGAKDLTTDERILRALTTAGIVTVAFIPMLFWMERLQYNRWLRRTGRAAETTHATRAPRRRGRGSDGVGTNDSGDDA